MIGRRSFIQAAAGAALAAGRSAPITLEVLTRERRQEIRNFSASDCWSMDPVGREWSVENRNRLADLLFSPEKGIGLSLWRFNVGAGGAHTDRETLWDPWRGADCFKRSADEPYDWSRQPGQQWFLKAARERGVRQFLAFANSPPVWLTANGHAYSDKGGPSTNLAPGREAEFARFLADVVAHFRRQGIPFGDLSPLNEPNWAWEGGQEGSRYANADIVRVVRALHAELRRRRLPVHIHVPDAGDLVSLLDDAVYREWSGATDPAARYTGGNNNLAGGKYREYIRDLLGPADLRAALSGAISAHSYWTDQGERNLVDLRRAVRRNLDAVAPGLRFWMSEYCVMEHKRDLGMDTALRVARVIHHDLVDAEASAWHWWLALSPADYKDGLLYTDWRQTGEQNIVPSRVFWVLGNYSRFVRPGARRLPVRVPGGPPDLLVSAYTGPARRLAVVAVNLAAEERLVRLQAGRQALPVTPHVTDAARELRAGAPQSWAEPVTLPPRSVVTLTAGDRPS